TPTFTGDGSAFCNSMLALGQVAGADGATPAEVLAANQELAANLDEAQANTPADAPPDLDALLDDYRAASQAIAKAKGDVDAALVAEGARVSIDTRKPGVAKAAVAAGASLLNDVGGANGAVAAELGVAWAAMHVQGEPATMQDDPRYTDVVAEVLADLV